MKTLKLQQTQEAGSILINEMKNILTTVLAATAVIEGAINTWYDARCSIYNRTIEFTKNKILF